MNAEIDNKQEEHANDKLCENTMDENSLCELLQERSVSYFIEIVVNGPYLFNSDIVA